MRKFNDLMNAANNFKGNLKVYMFLKDCAFRSIFNFFQNGQLTQSEKQNIQNLYGQFQNEINQYNWKISIMPLNEYQQFLNEFYSKNNFESADINTLIMAKELTENLSIFGNYDDVTKRRLDYFSNKIKSMQQMNMMNQNQMGGYSTNQYQNQQQIPQMNYNNKHHLVVEWLIIILVHFMTLTKQIMFQNLLILLFNYLLEGMILIFQI